MTRLCMSGAFKDDHCTLACRCNERGRMAVLPHEPNECFTSPAHTHARAHHDSLKSALAPTGRSLSVSTNLFHEYDTRTDTFHVRHSRRANGFFLWAACVHQQARASVLACSHMSTANAIASRMTKFHCRIHSPVIKSFNEME